MRHCVAGWLEKLVHKLRYGSWEHRPQYKFPKEITEDFFGDVYVVQHCLDCGVPYAGDHLGNTLLEEVGGETIYIGYFKADRMNRFLEQGYALACR
jgi:hypothetical protein